MLELNCISGNAHAWIADGAVSTMWYSADTSTATAPKKPNQQQVVCATCGMAKWIPIAEDRSNG